MKKIVCVILAIIQMVLCLAACGSAWGEQDNILYTFPSEIPVYTEDKQMQLIAFWSPPSTEEWYQSMVDCGFTDVIIDAKYDNLLCSDALLNTLAICDKVGIGAYLAVNRGCEFLYIPQYGDYESFKGVNTDEPINKENFDVVSKNIGTLKTSYQNKDVDYITNLACIADRDCEKEGFGDLSGYIEYYMQHGGSEEDIFMYDLYPLQGSSLKGQINQYWLYTLENMAAASKKYGVDLYSYNATMSIRSQTTRRPTEDDIRYVANVNLAYGVKGFGYFCYMTPGGPPYDGEFSLSDWAMVDCKDYYDLSTYYKTPTWDIVQKINNELKAIENIILSFDWQGVMMSAGSEATTTAGQNCFPNASNWLETHDGIKNLYSTEDAILGVFKDKNGYDGFMLVNFADTLYNKQNTVTLDFRGATRAVVYSLGESRIVNLENGTYIATLEPGEGQFIIPLS